MNQDKVTTAAKRCLAAGISIVPIGESKMPSVKWKGLIDTPLKEWKWSGCNMAILTGECNGIVVVDCDNRQNALKWLSTMPKTPLMVRTVRGMHFYYRHPGRYVKSDSHILSNGVLYDVKGDRSYVLAPPSTRKGKEYSFCRHNGNPRGKWMCPSLLPVFNTEWRPERCPAPETVLGEGIGNVAAYIDKIGAGEGERDRTTFRVAKIVKESGASESEAMSLVINWHLNNCSPPWTVMEISEKVKRVYQCT